MFHFIRSEGYFSVYFIGGSKIMILHQPSSVLVVVVAITIVWLSASEVQSSSLCKKWCGSGELAKSVPYPFGFSHNCPIKLDCTDTTGEIKIGEFRVLNITSDVIIVDVPAKCNRSLESIKPLFGQNFAVSDRNSLLLQNCINSSNGCFIPRSTLPSNFGTCDAKADNLSCFSPANTKIGVLPYEIVRATGCKFVYSSFAAESENNSFSVKFQRLQLEWWLPGSCVVNGVSNCSKNGNCTTVHFVNGSSGFRCHCVEGFAGDGLVNGGGCHRVSTCNAPKYMSGQCGGTTRIGVLVGGLVAGALLVVALALFCYFVKRRSTFLRNQLSARRLISEASENLSVPFYQFKDIERATNGFSEKQRLGTGAYGTVYAGKLCNDEWVAIKRIRHRDTDSIDQVMNELRLISTVSHPNLVRLLGCCLEDSEPILVYEFMPNGTLSEHLQRERGTGLPWMIRLAIAAENANAIAYLHSAMNPPIFHRDIKSSNILLDYNYKSKVADFGLSRLGMIELSHVSTAPQGTPGYLDPQYHQCFHLSDKSDVYSFGVVLTEIITGLKAIDFSRPQSDVNLAALAVDRIGRGCVSEIIDPYLKPHMDTWTFSSIHNVAEIAFRCLAFHRDMRPTMTEVAEELENIRLSAWLSKTRLASTATFSPLSIDNGSVRSS